MNSEEIRTDFVQTMTFNQYVGAKGTWRESNFCPEGSWAGGFRVYSNTERIKESGYDIKGIYFVELRCFDEDGVLKGISKSQGEDLGDATWSEVYDCPGKKNFINRFSIKVKTGGIMGVNEIWMGCFGDFKHFIYPKSECCHNPVSWCPSETNLCGLKPKFESDQGPSKDDTALNNLEMHCCRYCEKELSRYKDKETGTCKSCFYKCKTCFGGSSNECLSCFSSENLVGTECFSNKGTSFKKIKNILKKLKL